MTEWGYSIDIVIEHGGASVGVEVDGPSHFVGRSPTGTGATLLKRRQLQSLGWPLLSVPFFEWSALRNAQDRESYLQTSLGDMRDAHRRVGEKTE